MNNPHVITLGISHYFCRGKRGGGRGGGVKAVLDWLEEGEPNFLKQ